MKKSLIKKIVFFFFLFTQVSFSQTSSSDAYKLCVALQYNNFLSDTEAENAVQKIMSVVGISEQPILQACDNMNNAVAVAYRGQRFILYDPEFMKMLSKNTDDYWSNLFVLAHEVGHHVNGHSLDILLYSSGNINTKSLEEKRNQELQADEFAGFALAKLGATLQDATDLFKNLPEIPNENYSTHPNKEKRIEAVKRGYEKAGLGYADSELINYSLTENLDTSNIKSWDNVIENVKEDMLTNISDPFERINLIKKENIPDKRNTSWVTGKILKNTNAKFIDPRLFIIQEKYNNTEDIFSYTDLYFHNSFFIQNVLAKVPKNYQKTVLGYIRNGRFEFEFIFDDGYNGFFSSVSPDNKNHWGINLKRKTNESRENYTNRFKFFIEKLKKQKQLFIRISKIDYAFINGIEDFININDVENYIKTHQFDLNGSSKALNF
jgi:hypothetical protein